MNEYVIALKIKTDKPLMFQEIPAIIKECMDHGEATIMTAETFENWQEQNEKE